MFPRRGPRNQGPHSPPPAERRRCSRSAYCTAVILHSIRGENLGTVLNVSADGMFIQTGTPYMEGEVVDLTFTCRSARWTLALKAEVVRTTPGGIGVRILEY